MRILSKRDDEIYILALPHEKIEKGSYILLEDEASSISLLSQIYDVAYLDPSGIDEEILRDELFSSGGEIKSIGSDGIETLSVMLKDSRIYKAKLRGSIINGRFTPEVLMLPSRVYSKVRIIGMDEVNKNLGTAPRIPIQLGTTGDGRELSIDAVDLDGSLNIITGRKESGKSHLSKLLVSELVKHGAYVFIFDINNEYSGLIYSRSGGPSDIHERVQILEPGSNLVFTLRYIGKRVFAEILTHAFDTPAITVREFMKVWDSMEEEGDVSISNLRSKIFDAKVNEMVKEAFLSRYHSLISTKLFTNSEYTNFDIKASIDNRQKGAAFIMSMAKMGPLARRALVQIVISKLIDLLEKGEIPPVFLFAEEAHLYFDNTYWEDAITRMRHFGMFMTFITNQPDSLNQTVYRQADNVFLFNFLNEKDLEMISQASRADADTVKSIVKSLPPRRCLVIGKVVKDLPVVVNVRDLNYMALGATKRFFKVGP